MEDIKDELGAIFKARGEAAKNKANKVNKTKLPELSAEVIIRMGLLAIPILWEPMTAIFKLNLKVINLLNKLIFATWRTSKPIGGINIDVKSSLSN